MGVLKRDNYVVACSSSVLAIAGHEKSRRPQHFTGLDALNGLELSRVVVSAKTFIHHQRPVGAGGALESRSDHPQIFADQLTLSQTGGRLCPPHYF